ncbi:MAG: ABC transporter ATP-binding protein [Planctomycetes bacterium]|nr:ABC transporter ATP-binding protein [Planctomycetota bacterium]
MTTAAIDIEGLRVVHGDRSLISLDRLTVAAGQAWTILGPNGAGKSTLVKCCVGLVRAVAGDIRVLDEPVHRLRSVALTQLRRRVAYLAQVLAPGSEMPLTAREVVAIGRTGRAGLCRPLRRADWHLVDHWIDRLGLAHVARRLYAVLSGGEQRKTLLAMAMVQQPELLLLDEPTANLDAYWREQIVQTLDQLHQETGLTIMLVCHDLEAIPCCARHVLVLREGRMLAQGPVGEVLQPELIERLYGTGLTVVRRGSRYLLAPRTQGGTA